MKSGKNAGQKMGKLTMEDFFGDSIDVTMWPDLLSKIRDRLTEFPVPIRAEYVVSEFNGSKTLTLRKLLALGGEKK
jgi:hypothetical protein